MVRSWWVNRSLPVLLVGLAIAIAHDAEGGFRYELSDGFRRWWNRRISPVAEAMRFARSGCGSIVD
jgi:hypothetical protein